MKKFGKGVALVTGGASGIGEGLAHALAKAGMKVTVADLDLAGAAQVAADLQALGATALALHLDVRDAAQWITAVDQIERELGPLQVLCSNAGVSGSTLPIEETEWAGWQWTMDVNLNSTFHAIKTCLPRMRQHGLPSHIVCTASLGGLMVTHGNGAYSASKAAVIAVCEALAQEVAGSKIGISVLCPGLVRTQLLENNARLKPGEFAIGTHGPEIEAAMKAGMDPMQVGEKVVAWMEEGRFWMFTHPELRPYVEQRGEALLAAM
jgi:NAD(P)-dependent dehydrogenase (short-subunit alcohol dehydrogenase family)